VRDTESLLNPRLWLAFVTMVLVGGLAHAFPVFLPALLDEFGGSRAAAAGSVSVFWIASAILVPLSGRLIDRTDPRAVVTAGLVATALGITGAALSPSLGVFVLTFGAGAGAGAGLTGFVVQAAVIAETYRRRRGFATGIAFSGSMVGYALASPAQQTIESFGWRWTFAGWAVALLALIPLVVLYYPRSLGTRTPAPALAPGQATLAAPGVASVVRRLPFWALLLVFTAPPVSGYLFTTQHALYFTARGFSAGDAAAMLLVGGILSTSGRALAGLAADRIGAPAAGLISWAFSLSGALALVAFEVWRVPALAYAYVLLLFLPMGSRATIVSVLAARIAPPGRYGSVFGLLSIGNSLGAALGPFLSGALYDLTRSYLVIWLSAVAVILLAVTALVVFISTARR
jgi:MFS family permease